MFDQESDEKVSMRITTRRYSALPSSRRAVLKLDLRSNKVNYLPLRPKLKHLNIEEHTQNLTNVSKSAVIV